MSLRYDKPVFDTPNRCAYCGSKGEHLAGCGNPILTASPPPVEHMRQSANGCVTCPRKWSDHTPEERGEASPPPADALREALDEAYKIADDLDSNHARFVIQQVADRHGITLDYPPVNEQNNRLREQLAEALAAAPAPGLDVLRELVESIDLILDPEGASVEDTQRFRAALKEARARLAGQEGGEAGYEPPRDN